ncbi:FAD-dependent monooxygenase [Streptomyces hesseae]|uniref:squalene monooxygenase n=1 Tax=Streptomyces hesseae TaxID=3075519 RepID=A0ABU2SJT7_9ACTN|nr:FAD-dependent monooxygenase [Streptomyces sp. DSM 40473]MDT0449243.1 FAD-dependent monooxygenase [Streptomyces sp. DSM 40473]
MRTADVLVAGAGPAGCMTALAFARRGATVLIVDPGSAPARRLAGEWLHPAGVSALHRMEIATETWEFTANHGFELHTGDGNLPLYCPYPDGTAVSMYHHVLTALLMRTVRATPGISLRQSERVTAVTTAGQAVTTREELCAGLVVGADGCASTVRRLLRPGEPPPAPLSRIAGLLLRGARLPREGYGHVFLGGPGPVLAYQVSPDTIRLCLDVPLPYPAPSGIRGYLWHGYATALPDALRPAFREALTGGKVQWAAARFRRRSFFGRGRCALVGDAVGLGHPLAAQGMTLALLDGECLARQGGDISSYAAERAARSWSAERLSAALHRALTGTDPTSLLLRRAAFGLWRNDARQRGLVLGLLSMRDDRRSALCHVLAHVTTRALAELTRVDPVLRGAAEPSGGLAELAELADWLLWLIGPAVGTRRPPRRRLATLAVMGP